MKNFQRHIQNEFIQFEDAFSEALSSEHPLLSEVLNFIHSQRGKQLRPTLALLAAAICRGITTKTIQTAVILELTHTASLVHDDVIDNSPEEDATLYINNGVTRLPFSQVTICWQKLLVC